MSDSLEILKKHQYRDALLLAEVAAWLHMFGKFHEDFLEGTNANLDIEIPAEISSSSAEFAELNEVLVSNWTGTIWNKLPIEKFQAYDSSFKSLIKGHRDGSPKSNFRGLLMDAHGRGSGIEKGILARFGTDVRPNVYLATAFGFEGSMLDLNEIKIQRQKLYQFLQKKLVLLKNGNANLEASWTSYLNEFLEFLEVKFRTSLAETRRPFNDVTLFDQTALSVAFFKASLAQNLLLGWKDPSAKEVINKYNWRLLRIGLDGLAFWGNSARLTDLLARKQLIGSALDEVKQMLEVTYPLGFEIYRDESGSIFIVPDVDKLLSIGVANTELADQIQLIAQRTFSGETGFAIQPVSSPTRNTLSFGELAASAITKPSPNAGWLEEQWQSGSERQICYACGLRPWGLKDSKAYDRKLCEICEGRRTKRVESWLQKPDTTIWLDEVADKNGRVALVTGQFDLNDWLSGVTFNTILSFDPASRQLSIGKDSNGKLIDFDLKALTEEIKKALDSNSEFSDSPLLNNLIEDNQKRVNKSIADFYDLQLQDTDLADISVGTKKPELLALALLRQNPSFARIRRVWETTRRFWQEIQDGFETSVKQVGPRLKISGTFKANSSGKDAEKSKSLGRHQAYELKIGQVRFSIVCVRNGTTEELEFISAENLERAANRLGTSQQIKDAKSAEDFLKKQIYERGQNPGLQVEESTGYGSANTPRGTLQVTGVEIEQDNYLPVIPILAEPRTFMALVPADKSLEVVRAIRQKYECEMGKVRNRLPLTVGVVYAGARTPLPAILDAGRRMLKQPTQSQIWKVIQDVQNDPWPTEAELKLERAGQTLLLKVPVKMGDGVTDDVWYPYWKVEKAKDEKQPMGRNRQFTGPDGGQWVHVCDLKAGDTVELQPSRFDFEWLDTAARRFEISYTGGQRRLPPDGDARAKPRPYYLEQFGELEEVWKILSESLSTSQIKSLVTLVDTKRADWSQDKDKTVFEQLVEDAFKNIQWRKEKQANIRKPEPEKLEQLKRAARSGQLADVAELYLEILKCKPDQDDKKETNS